jgi:hypothetical protein
MSDLERKSGFAAALEEIKQQLTPAEYQNFIAGNITLKVSASIEGPSVVNVFTPTTLSEVPDWPNDPLIKLEQ